jgi:hypothetical protein
VTAQPDEFSLFAGWSGGGCSGTGECGFTVTTTTPLTATFVRDVAHSVRIDGVPPIYYSSLQNGFEAATWGIIRSWGVTFTENLTLNRPVMVKLMGGHNGAYTAQTGVTTINGKLTIGKGSLMVDRLTIR